MPSSETETPPKEYPSELKAILERANAGDPAALPALKKAFDEHPELVSIFGDLVRHAREAMLTLVAGTSLTAREAISREVDGLRSRLAAHATSELEKLLVDRIAISWLEVYQGDVSLAGHLLKGAEVAPATQAAQKRLDRAHARFLAAIKALATVQKLVRPAPSPLDLLARPVADTATARVNGYRNRGAKIPALG